MVYDFNCRDFERILIKSRSKSKNNSVLYTRIIICLQLFSLPIYQIIFSLIKLI